MRALSRTSAMSSSRIRPVGCLATRGVYAAPPTGMRTPVDSRPSTRTRPRAGGSTLPGRSKDEQMTFSEPVDTQAQGSPAPRSEPGPEPTLGALVHDLSQQVPELVRSEVRLAQAEMTEKGKRAGRGLGMFSVAG